MLTQFTDIFMHKGEGDELNKFHQGSTYPTAQQPGTSNPVIWASGFKLEFLVNSV